jgi:hypothetical protein
LKILNIAEEEEKKIEKLKEKNLHLAQQKINLLSLFFIQSFVTHTTAKRK